VSADSDLSVEKTPPLKTDVFYAMISLGSTITWSILGGWMLYFYLPPGGEALVPPALYGVVVFVVRAINAVLAAPIGYMSDRTRSRWGRRLPYMFASALPMLILFVVLWTPPVRGESIWNLVYLAPVFLVYNVAYSVNQITYTALLPELALTDRHRVRMSAWSSSFFLLGMVAGGLVGLLIDRVGYALTALIYAGAVLPLFYLPFLVLRERPERQDAAPERTTLRQSIAAILRNRAFLVMTGAGILYWATTAFVQGVIPYIVTEVCGLSEADTMLFYIPALGASLLCYPLITWLANRQGKWRVFAGSLLASAIVLPGLMLIGDWIPIPLKAQGIAWITLQAIAMSGVTMLPATFGAEITDYDAELSGERREGTFYATWGLLDQAINAVAAALLAWLLLLGRSRTDPYGPLGVRLVGVIGGVCMFVAFLIFLRYPLRHRSSPRSKSHDSPG
jgi:GPH family glycoside/pentoside/hexuronide:cation symporter